MYYRVSFLYFIALCIAAGGPTPHLIAPKIRIKFFNQHLNLHKLSFSLFLCNEYDKIQGWFSKENPKTKQKHIFEFILFN